MPIAHTKADKRRFQLIQQAGCIVCLLFHVKAGVPCDIHHLDGKAKKGSHQKTIGLCPHHHRRPYPGNDGVSLCQGKKLFAERYATEEELLVRTNKLIAETEQQFITFTA